MKRYSIHKLDLFNIKSDMFNLVMLSMSASIFYQCLGVCASHLEEILPRCNLLKL